MLIIFWISTFVLLACALICIFPCLSSYRQKFIISFFVFFSAYGCYFYLGSSKDLPAYYTLEKSLQGLKQSQFPTLLIDFKKQEYKLRVRLEDNPADVDAEWRLLDILAIKALQNRDYAQAVQYWEALIKVLPNSPYNTDIRARFVDLIKTYKEKIQK